MIVSPPRGLSRKQIFTISHINRGCGRCGADELVHDRKTRDVWEKYNDMIFACTWRRVAVCPSLAGNTLCTKASTPGTLTRGR